MPSRKDRPQIAPGIEQMHPRWERILRGESSLARLSRSRRGLKARSRIDLRAHRVPRRDLAAFLTTIADVHVVAPKGDRKTVSVMLKNVTLGTAIKKAGLTAKPASSRASRR